VYSISFLGVSSFIFALILTPFVRTLARRWNLVDQPDAARKLHTTPIPRLGGVAIVLSYLAAFGALFLSNLTAVHLVKGGIPLAAKLAPAVGLIFLVGLLDDLRPMRVWQKFVGQILAAFIAYEAGVQAVGFGGYHLPEYLNMPATIFWLVLCTNAVNLIDGVDGLATGVGLFATATTLLAALLQNNVDLALAVAPLLGCLFGFLRYNFNPATIFLGDSGSLSIGFFLGCCSIIWSQKSATLLGMTAPLLALAIPLLDTTLAVARRFLRGQPIFIADRGHIHHRLLDRGMTPRMVALIIYGICSAFAGLALLMMNSHLQGFVIILFCAATWIGVQHLGYVEFGVAGRMFVEGAFRRHLNANIALRTLDDRLKTTGCADEWWCVIQETAKDFGFHGADLRLIGQMYSYTNGGRPERSWTVRIPLSEEDWLNLTREFDTDAAHSLVSPYADVVRRSIEAKRASFESAGAPRVTEIFGRE
jgi:UDP-GlcNAc:undecaprenyl-phosphate GlcNAc-1-phosphate transferase